MKICADTICREMKETYKVIKQNVFSSGNDKSELQLYSAPMLFQEKPESGYVYVISGDEWTKLKQKRVRSLFLIVSDQEPEITETDLICEVLVISGISLKPVFNCVQKIFSKYAVWEQEVLRLVYTTGDIRALCLLTAELLNESVQFYDESIIPRVYVDRVQDELGNSGWGIINGKKVLSTEEFIAVHRKRDFNVPQKGLVTFDLSDMTRNEGYSIGYNMYSPTAYLGCTVISTREPISDTDRHVLNVLSEYVQQCLVRGSFLSDQAVDPVHRAVRQLVKGEHPDPTLAKALVERIICMEQGIWLCMLLRPRSRHNTVPLGYLCSHIETHYDRCIALVLDDEVCVFHRMERDSDLLGMTERLKPLFAAIDYQVGLSLQFYDITDAGVYYEQARMALQLGEAADPEGVFFSFYNNLYRYMLRHNAMEFPTRCLLPRSLQRILEHDEGGKSNYWETLKCYLDNEMNASETARELGIHRSSLLQRLGRIEEMMGEDLDTAEKRLVIRILMAQYEE